tara:strand:- start:254 stop:1174 length:921 start_codon:yes stop_codon:yes gene_type:complete
LKKKILILGGTGFIGSALINFFKNKSTFDLTSVSSKKIMGKQKIKNVRHIICDISKKKDIKKKLKNLSFDYIINLAGYVDHKHKIKTYNSHYRGVKNISNFFLKKKIRKFIQFGSSLEYGKSIVPHKENMIVNENSLKSTYAKSKYLATKHLININKKYKFPVVIFRLYLAYGPGQATNRVVPIVINNCFKNLNFEVSSGQQVRDFIFIDDLVLAVYKSLNIKKNVGKIYNLGSGKPIRVKDLIDKIILKIGNGKPIYGKIPFRKDEQKKIYPSIEKIKRDFKFSPKYSIEKGLEKTIKFYKKSFK